MICLTVIVASFFMAHDEVLASFNDSAVDCKEANHKADRILAKSNFQMESEEQDKLLADWYGFEKDVSLYALGWKLPVSVSLGVANGTLTGMNTLKRYDVASECSTATTRTLKGYFEYGPELSLSYDTASAKLFNRKIQGKLIFKPKLRLYVVLHNDTGSCRLETVRVARPEIASIENGYIFETKSKCWMDWFILKLLEWGLQLKDETPMMSEVVLWSQGEIFKYLTDAWCQS